MRKYIAHLSTNWAVSAAAGRAAAKSLERKKPTMLPAHWQAIVGFWLYF
jgi:hypothetical protein